MIPTQFVDHGLSFFDRMMRTENVASKLAIIGSTVIAYLCVDAGEHLEAVCCMGIAGGVAAVYSLSRSWVKTSDLKHRIGEVADNLTSDGKVPSAEPAADPGPPPPPLTPEMVAQWMQSHVPAPEARTATDRIMGGSEG